MKVSHTSIHHDPEGRINYLLAKHAGKFSELFCDNFVAITKETNSLNPEGIKLLQDGGFKIIERKGSRLSQLDTARHIAAVGALTRGKGEELFFGCLDRTLHWMETYPEELKRVVGEGTGKSDFLIIGRTPRAFETHPQVQRDPEIYTNQVTGRLLGMENVDVAAACVLMEKQTARRVMDFLGKRHRFTRRQIDIDDSLWPMIAKLEGAKIRQIRVEGLEFETPDAYKEEIKELGFEGWIEVNFNQYNLQRRWLRARETEAELERLAKEFTKRGERLS